MTWRTWPSQTWPVRARTIVLALIFVSLPGPLRGEPTDQFGRSHALSGTGHTILDFAASWCEPCYEALPRLEELAGEHPELRVLVINVDTERDGRDRMVAELDMHLPVIWDEGHTLVGRFGPRGFPATYVLDPTGEVVYHHVGYSKKKWRQLLELVAGLDP